MGFKIKDGDPYLLGTVGTFNELHAMLSRNVVTEQ